MNSPYPYPLAALDLLRQAQIDIKAARAARQSQHRRARASVTYSASAFDEGRQQGMEDGLALAVEILARQISQSTLAVGSSDAQATSPVIEAEIALHAAQANLSLADHGANAPFASAAYSEYVQAYKAVEQARANYVLASKMKYGTSTARRTPPSQMAALTHPQTESTDH